MNANVAKELGSQRTYWIAGCESNFNFLQPRNLSDVASTDFATEFGMEWTGAELAMLGHYKRFAHVENPSGCPQELCTDDDGKVWSLSFEDFGTDQFERYVNETTAQFVQSFELVDQNLRDASWKPNTANLMRVLVNVVNVDATVVECTYWWVMIEWSIKCLDYRIL